MNSVEKEEIFKLPICFNPKVKILNEHIITDLELKNTIDINEINGTKEKEKEKSSKPIYNYIFNPNRHVVC